MPIVIQKKEALELCALYRAKNIPMCVFGSGSFWNTEAVLLAAQRVKRERRISGPVAVVLAVTFAYEHMAQCPRFTRSGDPKAGLEAHFRLLETLCGRPGTPYGDIYALPHLDHAHPERDRWALTEGLAFFSSVMFDAQAYPLERNMALTAEYVAAYGDRVMVEGIVDELSVLGGPQAGAVAGASAGGPDVGDGGDTGSGGGKSSCGAGVSYERDESCESGDNGSADGGSSCGANAGVGSASNSGEPPDDAYVARACHYRDRTGVDNLVADLGTEQQSDGTSGGRYFRKRAQMLSSALGRTGIVLHGASSLTEGQLAGLGGDGVARLNMWTRIAREAGRYAASRQAERKPLADRGDFEAAEPRQYLADATESAAGMMARIMETVGYAGLDG